MATSARLSLLIGAAAALSACGGSRLIVSGGPLSSPPRAVVTTTNDAEVGEALAAGMRTRGYSLLGPAQTSSLVEALAGQAPEPGQASALQDVLGPLKSREVDAVLTVNVQRTAPDFGGKGYVDVVKLAVYGTSAPGAAQAGFEWHNSWGGMPGSPADHMMRKKLDGIVAEVGAALAGLLGAPGPATTVDLTPLRGVQRRLPEEVSQAAPSQPEVPQPSAPEPAEAAAPVRPRPVMVTQAEADDELLP